MTHPDTLQIPRAVVEQALTALTHFSDVYLSDFPYQGKGEHPAITMKGLRAALQAQPTPPVGQAAAPITFLKERAQLKQEWSNLRQLQEQYRAALARQTTPDAEAIRLALTPCVCDTCEGIGTIDETLGGYSFSNPKAQCPDCDGRGAVILGLAKHQEAIRLALEALKFAYNDCESDFVRDEKIDPAIAALEGMVK